MARERLQKLLARAGVASRRAAEQLVADGRVTVNGTRAGLGDSADPDTDRVELDGRVVEMSAPADPPRRPQAPRATSPRRTTSGAGDRSWPSSTTAGSGSGRRAASTSSRRA